VSDFSLIEAAANKVDDVVRSATWGLINQEQAVELGDHISGGSAVRKQKWMR
jgi:hypothetical protein